MLSIMIFYGSSSRDVRIESPEKRKELDVQRTGFFRFRETGSHPGHVTANQRKLLTLQLSGGISDGLSGGIFVNTGSIVEEGRNAVHILRNSFVQRKQFGKSVLRKMTVLTAFVVDERIHDVARGGGGGANGFVDGLQVLPSKGFRRGEILLDEGG